MSYHRNPSQFGSGYRHPPLAAAETFRSWHPNIPVRILTADPAMPYARQPLSKDFLRCRAADLNLHTPEWLAPRRRVLTRPSCQRALVGSDRQLKESRRRGNVELRVVRRAVRLHGTEDLDRRLMRASPRCISAPPT